MTKKAEAQVAATLNISNEQLKAIAMEAIREEVRVLLSTQLDNIVVGEMAKMKLFKPGTSDLQTMITNKVDRSISRAMGQDDMTSTIRARIYDRTDRIVREVAEKNTKEVVSKVKGKMLANLKDAFSV